ncbi:MAG TPA: methyltransferase domain-containing protein [Candidatus Saccharimonadales bacterium]|nr:methyltransferase domain-containing protein [Candidatus Saccharimonadales bacterium]
MQKHTKRRIGALLGKKFSHVTKVELGCGDTKREGFFGIDILPSPSVDLVLNIEKHKLPFPDNSIDHIYSSHTFEHLTNYRFVLREIMRVAKPDALVEIWTPYGKSNDGMLFGHFTFLSETSFKHICFEFDRFFLGQTHGYLLWEKTHYNLYPDIIKQLKERKIPLDFALEHLFNIALEWGVFLRVKKDAAKAPGPQYPGAVFMYGRGNVVKTDHPADIS